MVGRTSGVRSGDQDGDRLSSVRFVLSLAGVRIVARPLVLGVSGMVARAAFRLRSVTRRSLEDNGRCVRPREHAGRLGLRALGQRSRHPYQRGIRYLTCTDNSIDDDAILAAVLAIWATGRVAGLHVLASTHRQRSRIVHGVALRSTSPKHTSLCICTGAARRRRAQQASAFAQLRNTQQP